ncbi:MAG: holo-ACP synthase [bacterium]|jgi:holo-[acyl-carrier protein] synthase|nr:holo-ACP synthase [candidate division KSB1 bacterium]MDH7558824.1 holo-ACP synthase [bacterium]
MVVGVGIDIIEIARVDEQVRRHGERFLTRVFAPEEVAYCERMAHRAQHYAVRFAAKEATFKALGTGWQDGLSWQDVVLVNDHQGKPSVSLRGRAKELAERQGVTQVHVSVSHSKESAAAVVVLERG